MNSIILVVPDEDVTLLNEQQRAQYGENASSVQTYIGMDIDTAAAEVIQENFSDRFEDMTATAEDGEWYEYWFSMIQLRSEQQESVFRLYGGLFFVGIFWGLLFLVAAILIIYYKQLSEGLQDRRRYTIMRQVGLTDREIRSSIRSQVLTVFFLPLITAFVHTAFAFPMVKRCLNVLSMTNVSTFILCLVVCCSVFAVCYFIVYGLTSRVYYRIINQKE